MHWSEFRGALQPMHYFWNGQDKPVGENEPTGEQEIDGKIAARLLDKADHLALVSIPDGKVIAVEQVLLTERPTEIKLNVSLGSRSKVGP